MIYRVIGPPGTGKTTWVARQCRRAVEAGGSRGALVVSLTRAAAMEAGGRDTGLDEIMIGTLHSHCYRALGGPTVIDRGLVASWNETRAGKLFPLSPGTFDREPGEGGARPGDEVLWQLELARARCLPEAALPPKVQQFAKLWREWKAEADVVDFTDMIERAWSDVPIPPHSPGVLFADEAQDLSRLETRLLRRWGAQVDKLILVGDPAQALFDWRGADPEVLTDASPWKVLSQSYRVPRAVHQRAMSILRRMEIPQPEYHPRDEDGAYEESPMELTGATLVDEVKGALIDGTVMVIATCEYMLRPFITLLRQAGVPYHNPYSPRGQWNPFTTAGTSTRERLLAYLSGRRQEFWSPAQLKLWVPMIGAKWLRRGAKKRIEELEDEATPAETIGFARSQLFDPDHIAEVGALDPRWLVAASTAAYQPRLEFPVRCYEVGGFHALESPPRVVVGTVHSVKGGEAETVFVAPDVSPQGYHQWQRRGWYGQDAIRRVFYVAATRAKGRLVWLAPGGGASVEV